MVCLLALCTSQMLNLEAQIINQVNKAKHILIVFGSDFNGDALSASLALFLFLKKINKKVSVASSQAPKKETEANIWSFLPAHNKIENNLKNLRKFIVSLNIKNAKISQIKYNVDGEKLNFIIAPEEGWFKPEDVSSSSGGFEYDLIFTINTPDLESLGQIYDNNIEFFYKTNIINIDHQANNEEYGQINYIDISLSSVAELVFKIIQGYNEQMIDEDIATCLLTGIIVKTKNYKSSKLTPTTLLTSSKLISAGAKREDIVNNLYRSRSLSTLKIWGQILSNLKNYEDKKIALSIINQAKESDDENLDLSSLQDLAEEILNGATNTKILLIAMYNKGKNSVKLLAYANKGISAQKALNIFSGKGDQNQAYALLEKLPHNWKEDILEKVDQYLDKNIL